MIIRLLLGALIGAGLGALLGSTRSCETGGCPLTATPWRGGIYGGVMGLLLAFSLNSDPTASAGSASTSPYVEAATAESFAGQTTSGIVLVDFWSPTCGPCLRQLPILDQVERQLEGQARILKVDVTQHGELAQRYGVRAVPTLLLFEDGQERQRFVGLQTIDQLLSVLTTAIRERVGKIGNSARTSCQVTSEQVQ